jgi:small redox-active disulfide protein 2
VPKKVEVFAIGCAKCRLLEVATASAIEELGMDAEVTKLQDTEEMRNRGVMHQPALFIDGELKSSGRVPSVEEIKRMLMEQDGEPKVPKAEQQKVSDG